MSRLKPEKIKLVVIQQDRIFKETWNLDAHYILDKGEKDYILECKYFAGAFWDTACGENPIEELKRKAAQMFENAKIVVLK